MRIIALLLLCVFFLTACSPIGQSEYDQAYQKGYDSGWEEGYNSATEKEEESEGDIWEDGYIVGYRHAKEGRESDPTLSLEANAAQTPIPEKTTIAIDEMLSYLSCAHYSTKGDIVRATTFSGLPFEATVNEDIVSAVKFSYDLAEANAEKQYYDTMPKGYAEKHGVNARAVAELKPKIIAKLNNSTKSLIGALRSKNIVSDEEAQEMLASVMNAYQQEKGNSIKCTLCSVVIMIADQTMEVSIFL